MTEINKSFIEKYLYIGMKDNISTYFGDNVEIIEKMNQINQYQQHYKKILNDMSSFKIEIEMIIQKFVIEMYNKINVIDADINYILGKIVDVTNYKFNVILDNLNIHHLINLSDYKSSIKNEVFYEFQQKYINMIYNYIYMGKYGKTQIKLIDLINEKWLYINIETIIKFFDSFDKFNKIDISEYILLMQNKFDDIEFIKKMLNYINENFVSMKLHETKKENTVYTLIQDINEEIDEIKKTKQKIFDLNTFTFILVNLKSNGFLFYEQYFKNIKSKYYEVDIDILNNEIKLAMHFISVVNKMKDTNVNRYVNDMLINIRNYLFDLQESYYNNAIYQKIKINQESEKYKDVDITKFNRDLTNFLILKYIHYNEENILIHMHKLDNTDINKNILNNKSINEKLIGYLDIYRSFFKTRYPDREIEYDLIDSTMIVKMTFAKIYYIHMSLIQYIILDIIMKNENITIQEIFELLGIQLSKLNDTFNSLLKIKIIKRTSDFKFSLNKDFQFTQHKLSISGLVKKDNDTQKIKEKDFAHDRNMIVYCNLIYYAKKNTYFSRDTVMEELKFKIPFKLNDEYIDKAIEKALTDDYIVKKEIANINGANDVIYQYSE